MIKISLQLLGEFYELSIASINAILRYYKQRTSTYKCGDISQRRRKDGDKS